MTQSRRRSRGTELDVAPRVAQLWWITAVRGGIALLLGAAALLTSSTPEKLATFLALYWLSGGVLSLRFAWAIRPSVGFRLAAIAGFVAITAAVLVVLRGFLSGVISASTLIAVLGVASLAIGALRLIGAFEIERLSGHRWTIGGLVLGCLELVMGTLLIVTNTQSQGVVMIIGVWALASGTLLILEALRGHRLLSPGGALW